MLSRSLMGFGKQAMFRPLAMGSQKMMFSSMGTKSGLLFSTPLIQSSFIGFKQPSIAFESNSLVSSKKSSVNLNVFNTMTPSRFYSSTTLVRAPRSIFKPHIVKQQQDVSDVEAQTELSQLTPEIATHLRKTYATLATTTMISGVTCTLSILQGVGLSPMIGLLGGIGLILGIGFTPAQYHMARLSMLYGFAALEGLVLAPLVGATAAIAPSAVAGALIGTGAVFTGFTAIALLARSRSLLTIGGPLFGCLLGLIVLQLAGFFIPSLAPIANSVGLYGGLGLFSVYIAYDTQRMIENARFGQADYISDSLALFINIVNVFVRLLSIFRRDNN